MLNVVVRIALQALAIVIASAGLALAANALRPDGLPLVTDIEYEIFAPCKDSEAESDAADVADLAAADNVLYIDARPVEAFETEHVAGSLNVPYSVLFGASAADVERVQREVAARTPTAVVVYGLHADPGETAEPVDLAEPLAQQLVEAGIAGVQHLAGGMDQVKKTGVETVKKSGGAK
jgi:rhodanese-related sulfurtransferase